MPERVASRKKKAITLREKEHVPPILPQAVWAVGVLAGSLGESKAKEWGAGALEIGAFVFADL